jgi:hypothetical protein
LRRWKFLTLSIWNTNAKLFLKHCIFLLLVLICVRSCVNPRAQCDRKDYANWKNSSHPVSKPWPCGL